MSQLAPICLFVYGRPEHTRRTLGALARNPEAGDSDLIIFADGAKRDSDRPRVAAVRTLIQAERRFKSVQIHAREENQGLAASVIQGLTWSLGRHGAVIVLEDDIVTSPRFLDYMNRALVRYADEPRVGAIQGYQYAPEGSAMPMNFTRFFGSWGWATWKRSWDLFEPDGSRLLRRIQASGQVRQFNLDGTYNYYRMLKEQCAGAIDSWFIRWYASQFLCGNLSLWPGRSLTENIGMDGTGTHSPATRVYASGALALPQEPEGLRVEESLEGTRLVADFFRHKTPNPLERWCRYHCPVWLKRMVEGR